jgi:hypothetical protein
MLESSRSGATVSTLSLVQFTHETLKVSPRNGVAQGRVTMSRCLHTVDGIFFHFVIQTNRSFRQANTTGVESKTHLMVIFHVLHQALEGCPDVVTKGNLFLILTFVVLTDTVSPKVGTTDCIFHDCRWKLFGSPIQEPPKA